MDCPRIFCNPGFLGISDVCASSLKLLGHRQCHHKEAGYCDWFHVYTYNYNYSLLLMLPLFWHRSKLLWDWVYKIILFTLERDLNSYENRLFLQRTQTLILAPAWWFTTVTLIAGDPLLTSLAPGTYLVHKHMCKQNTQTHIKEINFMFCAKKS